DDLARQRARQRPRSTRRLEMLGRVAADRPFTNEVPVETAERRDAARDARRAQPADSQALEISDDGVGPGPTQTALVVAEEVGEVGEIAAVGTESISGGPPLCLEGAEILDDRIGHRVTTSDSITGPDNREGRARSDARLRAVRRLARGVARA